MKESREYSREELERRRGRLTWLQGAQARNRPNIWSDLDQQEKHQGDRSFKQMAWLNSPIGKWELGIDWPPLKTGERRKKKPPVGVQIQQVVYWIETRIHPEWGWTWRNSEKVKEIREWTETIIKWVWQTGVGIPNWVGLAGSLGKTAWERVIRKQRYPRRLRLKINGKDKERGVVQARKRLEDRDNRNRMEERKRYEWMLDAEILRETVQRHLRLNMEWLRVLVRHTTNWEGVVSKTEVVIKVGRSGRVLATYKTADPWEREWGEDRLPTGIVRFQDTGERRKGRHRVVVVKDEEMERNGERRIPIPIVVVPEKRAFRVVVSKDCEPTEGVPLYVAANSAEEAARGALKMKGVQSNARMEKEKWGALVTEADASKVRVSHFF